MKAVYKYKLDPYVEEVMLPLGAQVLHVAAQGADINLWVLVDPVPEDPILEKRRFRAFGTGHPIPSNEDECLLHVGTALLQGGTLVFHIFEVR